MHKIVAVFALPLLAGCLATAHTVAPIPGPDADFNSLLAIEYHNLAKFEADHMGNPKSAERFETKSRHAQRGLSPVPDHPDNYALTRSDREELNAAHEKLLAVINDGYGDENPQLLAMAQTRFDCWLTMRERIQNSTVASPCKDMFEQSMRLLLPPGSMLGQTYAVYFDSGRAQIDPEAMETLRQVAESFVPDSDRVVVLKGYTDSVGDRRSNEVMSLRRAVAVRNALAQAGIPMSQIRVEVFGQAGASGKGANRQDRRVELQIMTAYMAARRRTSDIEAVMPHYFATDETVF